jgi:hypothetical protein
MAASAPKQACCPSTKSAREDGEMNTRRGMPPDDIGPRLLSPAPLPRPNGTSGPDWRNPLRLGALLLTVLLIAAALIWSTRGQPTTAPAPTPTATPLATFLPLAGLTCVNDAAWSPTSDLIAFVGVVSAGCPQGNPFISHAITIVRAQPASLVRRLNPDDAIYAALGLATSSSTTTGPSAPDASINYATLRWSPDGTRLALSFSLFSPGGGPRGALAIDGLLLLSADGSQPRVLVDPLTGTQAPYTVWDPQTGKPVAVPANTLAADAPYSSLVAAQSYSWGAGGALVPGAPFGTAPAQRIGLVGNPIGSAQFGPWQPGLISAILLPPSGQQSPTYLYTYGTRFAAWSPDGRYFADALSVLGLLRAAGEPMPPPSLLSELQFPEHIAALPVRDAGLAEATAHDLPLPSSVAAGPSIPVPLAWRADGKVLAVLSQHNGYILRATETDRELRSVEVMQLPAGQTLQPQGLPGTWNTPLWSPDGAWLLLPTLALVKTSNLGV